MQNTYDMTPTLPRIRTSIHVDYYEALPYDELSIKIKNEEGKSFDIRDFGARPERSFKYRSFLALAA